MIDGFLMAVIRRDVVSRLRERWGIALWIAIPLVLGGMIMALFTGSNGPKPVATLLLVDEDQSLLSGVVGGAFNQGELAALISVEAVADLEPARERIEAGEASALLIIPAGFGTALLENKPVNLNLITNPSQRILPGIIEEVLSLLVDGTFYLQQLFAPELDALRAIISEGDQNGPSDATVAAMGISANRAMASLAEYLYPPRLSLEVPPAAIDEVGDQASYMVLLFPGMVLMALMFAAQSLSNDFWRERQAGTLARLASAPRSLNQLLLGKALAVGVLLTGVGGVVLTLGFLGLDLDWSRLPVALLWQGAGGVLLFAMMSVVALCAPSQRAASILTSLILFPSLMIGGSFFPLESMPEWLAGIGAWTPNGLVLSQLKDYLLGRTDWKGMLVAGAGLLTVTTVLLGLCRLRLAEFARR